MERPTLSTASTLFAAPLVSLWIKSPSSGAFSSPPPLGALLQRDQPCAYRVIYNPFLNKLYSALKGQGAYLNETTRLPLTHPSPFPLASLSDAVVATEWGSDRSKRVIEKKASTFSKLAGDGKEVQGGVMAHALRSIGCVRSGLKRRELENADQDKSHSSAALNYSYVAAGQLDLYWEVSRGRSDGCDGAERVLILRSTLGNCRSDVGRTFTCLMGHKALIVAGLMFFALFASSLADGTCVRELSSPEKLEPRSTVCLRSFDSCQVNGLRGSALSQARAERRSSLKTSWVTTSSYVRPRTFYRTFADLYRVQVVRAIGDTETEKGSDAQDRIAREFFAVAEEWDV